MMTPMARELLVFNMISVDGFFARPNGDIDWHTVDEEFNTFAIAQLEEIDTLLFGRRTYDLMASYWPTEQARGDDPEVAAKMNGLSKVVFSRTLRSVSWSNARLASSVEELAALKGRPGKALALFGSADLLASLIPLGLVDEYRLMVSPVVLGAGKPLFRDGAQLNLELAGSRRFGNGNVLLSYRPRRV